jgi:DNA-binding response OmpR family regulator
MSSNDKHTAFKILLVEDNPGDAFLIKFYLDESQSERYSYEVDHVEELYAAFEKLNAQDYDIILLDLGLPDAQGLETLQKLIEKHPDNLVIVMTGLTDEQVGVEAVKMGAQDFLIKGRFDAKVLSSSIRYAFERFQMNQEVQGYSLETEINRWRLNFLEKAMEVHYAEFYQDGRPSLVSDKLIEEFRITDPQNFSLEDFLGLFDGEETVRNTLNKAQADDGHIPIEVKKKDSKKQFEGGVDLSTCPVRKVLTYRFLLKLDD